MKWLQSVYHDPYGAKVEPSATYMLMGENCRVTIHHFGDSFDAVAWDVNRVTNRFRKQSFSNLADAKAWGEDMETKGGW